MEVKPTTPPDGMFEGHNIMTPEVIDYYKLSSGYAELSEGRGIYKEKIFGVTVRGNTTGVCSQLFHSLSGAMDYIEENS